MVHSRSFTVDAGARGLRRFMVPLVDMLNHEEERGCDFSYDEEEDAFVVEWLGAGAPPGPGEQVYLNYGAKSCGELLLMYGFVPPAPTPHDTWTLDGAYSADDWAAAPGDDAMRAEKEALLSSCRYASPRTFEVARRR
eukprot:3473733-Prymnesium_polylepis.1